MIKFNQDQFENFGYEFHLPQFAQGYVLENGLYVFSTVKDDIKIEVKLSTGNSFKMNDYNFPNPDYEIEYVKYDDEIVSLVYVENDDYDLYEAICDLPCNIIPYSQNVDNYLFNCEGRQEHNFGEKITVSYENLDLLNYSVIDCTEK